MYSVEELTETEGTNLATLYEGESIERYGRGSRRQHRGVFSVSSVETKKKNGVGNRLHILVQTFETKRNRHKKIDKLSQNAVAVKIYTKPFSYNSCFY